MLPGATAIMQLIGNFFSLSICGLIEWIYWVYFLNFIDIYRMSQLIQSKFSRNILEIRCFIVQSLGRPFLIIRPLGFYDSKKGVDDANSYLFY